ncbi:hypothetical protein BDR07DRAFT_1338350 [Suillus spraguei]|nr:hypothetical protein BDR07DRAFT_1338350 [Suillus spraguei]
MYRTVRIFTQPSMLTYGLILTSSVVLTSRIDSPSSLSERYHSVSYQCTRMFSLSV